MLVETPCPGESHFNAAELNLWLTINLKEPKHSGKASEAWRRRRKTALARFVCESTVWARVAQHLSASIRFPRKNSLISNGLIPCSWFGLHMFSLMTFHSYSIEQRQDFRGWFSFETQKDFKNSENIWVIIWCRVLQTIAANNKCSISPSTFHTRNFK